MKTIRFIWSHPLSKGRRLAAIRRWAFWQLGSRLLPGPVIVPYVNDAHLLLTRGLRGATGNIYVGLHEHEDMAFVLHVLRSSDFFVDVGANVGAYTVLAAGVVGARSLSIEPIPSTFEWLMWNIRINKMEGNVEAKNIGIGSQKGTLKFTTGFDAMNRVAIEGDDSNSTVEVPVQTLDEILGGRVPLVVKIDVEGFETAVVEGASATLGSPDLAAVIMELNGSGAKHGYDENLLHGTMVGKGFSPHRYNPFERTLFPVARSPLTGANILYVRDIRALQERLQAAPKYKLSTGIEI